MGQRINAVRVIRHTNNVIYAWRGRTGFQTDSIYYDDCIAHMSMHDFPDNRPYYDMCAVLDLMDPTEAHNGVRFYHMTHDEWRALSRELRVHDDDS